MVTAEDEFLGYVRILYTPQCFKLEPFLSGAGIYLLSENNCLYCGKTEDLDKRPMASGRERSLRDSLFIYHSHFLKIPKYLDVFKIIEEIEALCISALLRKSADERFSPFPRRIYPTAFVTGMPRAV